MADLVAFLRARYDEADAAVQRNLNGAGVSGGCYPEYPTYADEETKAADAFLEIFTPEFMLDDIAAKRRLIAGHGPGRVVDESDGRWASDPDSWDPPWTKCTGHEWEAYPCELLRLLALPYAGHPDYRPEWKPDTRG